MDLSIIIINYKSAQLVVDCIQSILLQTQKHRFEIILVDNNSEDDCEAAARAIFPALQWIQMGYNAGFARANNRGIRQATGKYILLLNADTIILEGAIDKACELFRQTDVVACGVQLLNPDGSHQISGARFVKGGLNNLLPLPYLGRFIRYIGLKFNRKRPSIEIIPDYVEVDWLIGAFMLIKKEVLDKTGLMDEDFFMYMEEVEWCGRLRQHGRICLFGQPRIIHYLGGTSNSFYKTTEKQNTKNVWNKKGRQIMLSNLVSIRKQYGIAWFLVILFFYLFEIPLFFFGILFSKLLKGSRAVYEWNNLAEYTANALKVTGYFFRILFNKPFFYKVS